MNHFTGLLLMPLTAYNSASDGLPKVHMSSSHTKERERRRWAPTLRQRRIPKAIPDTMTTPWHSRLQTHPPFTSSPARTALDMRETAKFASQRPSSHLVTRPAPLLLSVPAPLTLVCVWRVAGSSSLPLPTHKSPWKRCASAKATQAALLLI